MNLQIKKKLKISILWIVAILLVLLSYEILWGKLFSYSPIFIGVTKHELFNTVIQRYYKNWHANSLIENSHELKFLSKPKLFFFSDSR